MLIESRLEGCSSPVNYNWQRFSNIHATPSPSGASSVLPDIPSLVRCDMKTSIDDIIVQQITFLKDQLAYEDDSAYIRTFLAQVKTLQTAHLDRLDELIAIRKIDLKNCVGIVQSDMIYAEPDVLELLQRQVMKNAA